MGQRDREGKDVVHVLLRFELLGALRVGRVKAVSAPKNRKARVQIGDKWLLRHIGALLKAVAVEEDVARNRAPFDADKAVPGIRLGRIVVDEIGTSDRRFDSRRTPIAAKIPAQPKRGARARIGEDV